MTQLIQMHRPQKLLCSLFPFETSRYVQGFTWNKCVSEGCISKARPVGVVALVILFVIGTCASFLSAVSLIFPGSLLEPIWRLNPHARAGFSRIGAWAIVLMICVCIACCFTAVGLWRRRSWGYWLAVVMLVVNLGGDVVNVIIGTEPRALIGIPIAGMILAYLLRKQTRYHFSDSAI